MCPFLDAGTFKKCLRGAIVNRLVSDILTTVLSAISIGCHTLAVLRFQNLRSLSVRIEFFLTPPTDVFLSKYFSLF